MNIKITIRNSELVTIPSKGETAESWLTNIRRSGDKYTTLNGTAYPTQDILDAVDEKPRKGQANLGGAPFGFCFSRGAAFDFDLFSFAMGLA